MSSRTKNWSILAQSVRGAIHCRRGEVNQDAIDWMPLTGSTPPLILAVSDGHGSAKSFRSDRGSAIASSVAIFEVRLLLDRLPDRISSLRRAAKEQLPSMLVRAWEERIIEDISRDPFTKKERRRFVGLYGSDAWEGLEANPLLAYGATLLVAVATKSALLLVQIGDGDIVAVSPCGAAARPFDADPRLFAGETTSLCQNDAVTNFCVRTYSITDERPSLVLLSTDGYANSYEEDAGFLRVGSDLLAMLREDGAATVQRELAAWLEEVSRCGSGDDITLGALCLL